MLIRREAMTTHPDAPRLPGWRWPPRYGSPSCAHSPLRVQPALKYVVGHGALAAARAAAGLARVRAEAARVVVLAQVPAPPALAVVRKGAALPVVGRALRVGACVEGCGHSRSKPSPPRKTVASTPQHPKPPWILLWCGRGGPSLAAHAPVCTSVKITTMALKNILCLRKPGRGGRLRADRTTNGRCQTPHMAPAPPLGALASLGELHPITPPGRATAHHQLNPLPLTLLQGKTLKQ